MLERHPRHNSAKVFLLDAEDNLLVVRRSLLAWRGRGKYDLPGGGIKRRERPVEAAVREIKEEIFLDIEPGALRQLWDTPTCNFLVGYVEGVKPAIRTSWENYSPAWPYLEDAGCYLQYQAQVTALGRLIVSDLRRQPLAPAIDLPRPREALPLETRTAS